MLIDTHCHLDASVFKHDRDQVMQRAASANVAKVVIPAVAPFNFQAVRDIAHAYPGGAYALGIHPICVPDTSLQDLNVLEAAIQNALDDTRFVAIGEIGLDYFLPELKTNDMQRKQEEVYSAQLGLARKYDLPVILHVRRSQDRILKYLRTKPGITGIAHAFNGSHQQARAFLDLGFVLGAGGALTFSRARQIRRLATDVALEHWVLETDAPDIPPAWLHADHGIPPRNEPSEVAGVARVLAELKGVSVEQVHRQTGINARRVLTRL